MNSFDGSVTVEISDDEFDKQALNLQHLFPSQRYSCLKWLENVTRSTSKFRIELVKKWAVLPLLFGVLSNEKRSTYFDSVCLILRNISNEPENIAFLMDPRFELIPKLINILRSKNLSARIFSCEIISNLAIVDDNQDHIATSGYRFEILQTLKEILCDVTDDSRYSACITLDHLSVPYENKYEMAGEELGLVDILVKVIKTEKEPDIRICACSIIGNLSYLNEDNSFLMPCANDILSALIQAADDPNENLSSLACAALGNYSSTDHYSKLMVDPQLNLFGILGKMLEFGKMEAKVSVCFVLANLSVTDENKSKMANSSSNILRGLKEEIQINRGDNGQISACAAAAQIAFVNESTNACINVGLIPIMVFVVVSGGPDPSAWSATVHGKCAIWAVNFFLNIAQWTEARPALRASGVTHALLPLVQHRHRRALHAGFALSFLLTEPNQNSSLQSADSEVDGEHEHELFDTVSQSWPRMMSVLEAMSQNEENEFYKHNSFKLSTIIRSLYHLSAFERFSALLAIVPIADALHQFLRVCMHDVQVDPSLQSCVDMILQIFERLCKIFHNDEDLVIEFLPRYMAVKREIEICLLNNTTLPPEKVSQITLLVKRIKQLKSPVPPLFSLCSSPLLSRRLNNDVSSHPHRNTEMGDYFDYDEYSTGKFRVLENISSSSNSIRNSPDKVLDVSARSHSSPDHRAIERSTGKRSVPPSPERVTESNHSDTTVQSTSKESNNNSGDAGTGAVGVAEEAAPTRQPEEAGGGPQGSQGVESPEDVPQLFINAIPNKSRSQHGFQRTESIKTNKEILANTTTAATTPFSEIMVSPSPPPRKKTDALWKKSVLFVLLAMVLLCLPYLVRLSLEALYQPGAPTPPSPSSTRAHALHKNPKTKSNTEQTAATGNSKTSSTPKKKLIPKIKQQQQSPPPPKQSTGDSPSGKVEPTSEPSPQQCYLSSEGKEICRTNAAL